MRATLTLVGDGTGRRSYILPGYRPSLRVGEKQGDCFIDEFEKINPGETGEVRLRFIIPGAEERFSFKVGDKFTITEGLRIVANGIITEL